MKFDYFQEPQLEFGDSIHVCPRRGISEFNAYDIKIGNRRKDLLIGVIGTNDNIEKFFKWVDSCRTYIPAKLNNNQPNLFTSFCGFNEESGFKANLILDEHFSKSISNQEIKGIKNISNWEKRLEDCVEIYYSHISYLAVDKGVDVVICIIPNSLQKYIMKQSINDVDESIEDKKESTSIETDFRRLLKAKAMQVGKPIQLILQNSIEPYKEKSGRQDDATKAWNFFTALYYKTNHIPWRLIRDNNKVTKCFIGISFYRSRDKKQTHTSLAQLFDDLGNGVILRGSPVEISEDDKQPHLTEDQAFMLFHGVVKEYENIHKTTPARIVIHKTSNFNSNELDGFSCAADDLRISLVDYITIMDTSTRLFRNGLYPIKRGSYINIDQLTHLLFTRGSIDYYQTYPGLYVPRPLEIRIVESDESARTICEEILSLTKMNWNNTQMDGKYPITIECARRVGLIMKYIPENIKPQSKYCFYM